MADAGRIHVSPSDVKRLNKSRKRKIHMCEWSDVKRKKLRDSGKPYKNRRGKEVPGKTPPDKARVCDPEVCRKEGCSTMTLEIKLALYEEYHRLTYDEQSMALVKCIVMSEPARRKKGKCDANSRKFVSFKYVIAGKQVCQKNLLDIYQITQRRIQTLQAKLKDGAIVPKDNRGRHKNRPHAISDEVKESVRTHINSFPREISHYSRRNSTKECLNPELNLSRLYSLYKVKYPDMPVSRSLYEEIFNDDFKLRFGTPRSDTCKYCDALFIKLTAADNESDRQNLLVQSELHHRKADSAYVALKTDIEIASKNTNNTVTLCVDLQQVMFCPTLSHSSVFYQRQLSNYNFAIHDMGSGSVTMNIWYECIAKRGSAEIASFILKYVVEKYNILEPHEERKLIVWSDRCVGQNNNWRILSLYMYLVHCGYFTEISQKFLCSGHSFLPCDRDFALIEKRKKLCQVMVPSEWKHVIANASLKKPFLVNEIQQHEIKDFTCIESKIKRDPKIKITQRMWFKFLQDDPSAVHVRKSHNVLQPWERHVILRKGRGYPSIQFVLPLNLPPLYNVLLPITKEKKEDLKDMCQYMKQEYREFYEQLPSL